jgi:hypothetical protein
MNGNRNEKQISEGTLFRFFRLNKWSLLISSVAIAFILIGLLRANGDEVKTLLMKAINICMECIGIG